jgi:hypothetical protein
VPPDTFRQSDWVPTVRDGANRECIWWRPVLRREHDVCALRSNVGGMSLSLVFQAHLWYPTILTDRSIDNLSVHIERTFREGQRAV